MSVKLNIKYLCAFFITFAIEALIAIYVNNNFIRGSIGDVLVVVLIYCFIKSFVRNEVKLLPLYIFIFAALVEIGQYFDLVDLIGLGDSNLARIVLGNTFDMRDIFSYLVGCATIWFFERLHKSSVI